MNDAFAAAVIFALGAIIGIALMSISIQVTFIKPCEIEIPRNMHCELTAKISGDKHE